MRRTLLTLVALLLFAGCLAPSANGRAERPGGIKVLCWNDHFPKKGHGNIKATPEKCSLYRRGYDYEAAGAVHMRKLKWKHWGDRSTTAKGEYAEPMDVDDPWKPIEVKLKKPVERCGHTVYSKAVFHVPGVDGHGGFPIWTC